MIVADGNRQRPVLCASCRAFTMVELLVVIVIIGILIGAVVVAGGTLVTSAKVKQTEATLAVVREAVEQFGREQASQSTIARAKVVHVGGATGPSYHTRYGYFPPDELDVFQTPLSLAPRTGASPVEVAAGPSGDPLDHMLRYTLGLAEADRAREHRDLAAMMLAIELYSDKAMAMLERLPERSLVAGMIDPTTNKPLQFLDRNGNGNWDSGDVQIRYVVDSWGVPLAYMAQRDYVGGGTNFESSNQTGWNQASTELINLNGGQPVIFSWGPDGKEQLTQEWMKDDAHASLVVDWRTDGIINDPLNLDNVYAEPSLKERLAERE